MKECYEAPEMEIIVFEADVITVNSSQPPANSRLSGGKNLLKYFRIGKIEIKKRAGNQAFPARLSFSGKRGTNLSMTGFESAFFFSDSYS